MSNLEAKGKLVTVLPEQSGVSKNGNWKKQDFVIETDESYPKKICFTVWNEKVEALQNFKKGDELKVAFSVASREYNGKWYNDITALSILTLGASSGENEVPRKNTNNAQKPMESTPSHITSEEEDDLPF